MKRRDRHSPPFEEIRLWNAYAAGVERISSEKKITKPAKTKSAPEQPVAVTRHALRPDRKCDGGKAVASAPYYSPAPVLKRGAIGAVNPEYEKRLSRGEVNYDSRLDLHGMTADRAFTALVQFVTKARLDGQKILLIITGKGRPDPETGEKIGTLKSEVPVWAENHPKLNAHIRKITPASAKHGGEGAFYFILKR